MANEDISCANNLDVLSRFPIQVFDLISKELLSERYDQMNIVVIDLYL